MKNWNRTGKIKAIVLGVFSLPNLIFPMGMLEQGLFISVFMPLISGSILIPIISKLNNTLLGQEIVKPEWNDNPLNLGRPLSFFHFGAFFFIAVGLSVIIGTLIRFKLFNVFGLSSVSFGIGILIGINLTLMLTKEK